MHWRRYYKAWRFVDDRGYREGGQQLRLKVGSDVSGAGAAKLAVKLTDG